MEPAPVLVRSFQIEIGRKSALARMRALQDREMRGARIEPDIERIAALFIARGIGTKQFLRA